MLSSLSVCLGEVYYYYFSLYWVSVVDEWRKTLGSTIAPEGYYFKLEKDFLVTYCQLHLKPEKTKTNYTLQCFIQLFFNMAQRHDPFCERHVALHERHVSLLISRLLNVSLNYYSAIFNPPRLLLRWKTPQLRMSHVHIYDAIPDSSLCT